MSERKPPSLAFTAFERALLRSADADEAPAGAARRALLALGVGTSHAAVSQSASGSAVPTPGAAWTLWQKPLLIGVLGGVGLALSARIIDEPAPRAAPAGLIAPRETSAPIHAVPLPSPTHRPPTPPDEETPARTPARVKKAPPAVLAPTPGAIGNELPPAPTATHALPPPPVATADGPRPPAADSVGAGMNPSGAPSSSIAAEVMVVDRARGALRDGRPREALVELARYRQQWPLGVLTPEVTVLQIEAELRLGARDAARRRARDLVATQPNSRYAARLRNLFDESELR
jgi:hypothetical protein